jgi:hypothetical protein
MRHVTSFVFGAAVALGLAVGAQAQQNQPPVGDPTQPGATATDPMADPKAELPLSGQIVAKDDAQNTFSIQTDDGQKVTFKVNPTTKYRSSEGQSGELADLKVGDRVQVEAQPGMAGAERVALSVQVQPETQAPGSTPNSAPEGTGGSDLQPNPTIPPAHPRP